MHTPNDIIATYTSVDKNLITQVDYDKVDDEIVKSVNFKSKLILSIALKTGFPSVLGVISYYNRAFKRTMIISIFKFIDCIIFASKIVKYYNVFNSTGHRCTNLAHKISKKSLVSVTRW